ncbi:uncharacterized protein A1O5_04573 [Cladophialophora psammophila CBS 110553]|uniref:CPAF-like PDZ domain-containing protein n=1 Tax=Cladophialophora psammophila CBS 110553 TaxID=1182543 RepID=W9X444_9EURO|nr:uncharacterized protein A1O5_04573 [Cladophialophora psammophila CBS 110553]EXJ72070.1 hypothetical protein A1O5_04573 [Cladophialophora psammophila CBS 110553]
MSTGTPTAQEPCAQVGVYQRQYQAANPGATSFTLPAVPLVKEDTLAVLTGLQARVQWQSTLHWVKDPPAHWPLPPVDIIREIDFEWKLVDLLNSVHDGHFTFLPDAYFVFTFLNLQPIISLSTDGKQLPEIYLYNDLEPVAQGEGWEPSPIVKINGTEAVSWLSERAFNGTMTFLDLDALYNGLFHSISAYSISAPLNQTVGYFALPGFSRFWGSSINLEFKNGSKSSIPIEALTAQDFSNVIDGESFYQTFCNTTVKTMAAANGSSASTSQQTSTTTPDATTQIPQYPSAIAISDDGSLASYFLEDEPSVAVLAVLGMSETAQLSTQQTLSWFLQRCRETNKTRLIVDVSQNGGGTIAVAYDIFKQLFPTLEPYLGAQLRAHEQANILVNYFTRIAQQVEKQQPGNVTALKDAAGYQSFDVSVLYNDGGVLFQSWEQPFGPVQVHGGNFTNQYQLDLSNADYDEATGGIVVTGYANNSNVAPQPFLPENIMAFSDGFCGSACTIFMHLLKYQGKVKSIVAGGRPQTGPQQAIGGVKGSQVEGLSTILGLVQYFYQTASPEEIKKANQTALKDLADYGNTLLLRDTQGLVQVNFQNAIAQYDQSQTPLQFVYEAADCRL